MTATIRRTLLSSRVAAVVVASAFLAAGCGGSSDTSDATDTPSEATSDETTSGDATSDETVATTETTVEQTTSTTAADSVSTETSTASAGVADPPTIDIIDQGAEPRSELRYVISDGVYTARLSQTQSLSQTIDGQLMSEVADLGTLFEVELTSRVVPEGFEFTAVYTDVSMGEDTDPTVSASMMDQLGQLVGSAFLSTIDDQGYVLAQAFEPPAGATNGGDLQALMESIAGQNQFANPLPTEPMGVGGSWKQTQSLTLNGIAMVQETIYSITAIDGTQISMSVTGKQIVPPGPVAFPGLPEGVDVTVESWDVTTAGTIVTDLGSPFPSSSATVEGAQVLVGTGAQEFRLEQGLTNSSTITPG